MGIDRAFKLSSRALMDHLVKHVRIRDRLNSLKKFFLVEQGDYLMHFLDSATFQLGRPASYVSRSSLTSLLQFSIRSSAVEASSSFIDDLSIDLMDKSLSAQISALLATPSSILASSNIASSGSAIDTPSGSFKKTKSSSDSFKTASVAKMINGFEALTLRYDLKWPIKSVVSPMDVSKYQLLFRYLFYAKHVERELVDAWRVHGQAKGPLRFYPAALVRSFSLRNRMLQFIRSMLYYDVADIIEPQWKALDAALRQCHTIDDIMEHHGNFLSACALQTLLSDERHQTVFKYLCDTCLAFVKYTRRFDSILSTRSVPNTKIKGPSPASRSSGGPSSSFRNTKYNIRKSASTKRGSDAAAASLEDWHNGSTCPASRGHIRSTAARRRVVP